MSKNTNAMKEWYFGVMGCPESQDYDLIKCPEAMVGLEKMLMGWIAKVLKRKWPVC